jgi:hypothetical protein
MRELVAALACALLLPVPGAAQIFRWEDDRGTIHYTNAPERLPDSSYRTQVEPLEPARPEPPPAPDPASAPAVLPGAGAAHFPYTPGEGIVVSARIAGSEPLRLLLDTGADRTIVAPQALSRVGISTLNAPRAAIKGVTGRGQGGLVQIASLDVGPARVGPLRIIAHDADLGRADGLLGRDFLDHFTVTIDARARQVTLTPR